MSATPLAIQSFHNQNKFSTPTSPFSVNDASKSPAAAPYLPGFLLGNTTSPSSPAIGRSLSTSAALSTAGYQNSSPSKISSKSPPNRSSGFPYSSPLERKQRVSPNSSSTHEGAPPVESLYSTNPVSSLSSDPETPRRGGSVLIDGGTANRSSLSMLESSVFSPRTETIPQSPAQLDPFYSQGESISSENVIDDTAVTVFGFPPAAASFILHQFSQYGTVDKHEIHNSGNWLHIKYQTKIQAKKALSKNGKIFARSIMIGVLPCIKQEISAMEAELNNSDVAGSSVGTPQVDSKKLSTMRSLSSTAGSLKSASDSICEDKRTPSKKDSVVGKALDYVFGW